MGTIRWSINDNNGMSHDFVIANSYNVKQAPTRLFSPQHWAQEANNDIPEPNGSWCATYKESVVLQWQQRKYQRTLPIHKGSINIGIMHTTAGYDNYNN